MTCRHCKRERFLKTRGLCGRCYTTREIRDLYPPARIIPPEPTQAEVDAMVCEGLANLPRWWSESGRYCQEPPRPRVKVFTVVKVL